MLEPKVGDRVALCRGERIVDRGVVENITDGHEGIRFPHVRWEHTTLRDFQKGDEINRLRSVQAGLTFLELNEYDLTEAEFRGGSTHRRTDLPWSVPDDHKERLRPWLEAHGFDVSEEITAQEKPDQDGFLLTQEFAFP